MNAEHFDLYTDYLLSSFGPTTATGLSALLDERLSHDQVTRLVASPPKTALTCGRSSNLWCVPSSLRRRLSALMTASARSPTPMRTTSSPGIGVTLLSVTLKALSFSPPTIKWKASRSRLLSTSLKRPNSTLILKRRRLNDAVL